MHDAPSYWTIARTKPSRELYAADNIARQGHEYYLPRFSEMRMRKRRGMEKRLVCLFPSYIFVMIELGKWTWLLSTYGLSGIPFYDQHGPKRLAEKIINELKSRERKGIIMLDEREANGLVYGQRVRVTGDLFANELGIYQDMGDKERVNVLLNVLGRPTKVTIRRDKLEAA